MFKGARANALNCLNHYGSDGWLNAKKNRRNDGHLAKADVYPRKGNQNK